MEEKDITLLDNYFNGLLTAEERQAVLNRAGSEPGFAREFELRQQMENWPKREARRKALMETLDAIGPAFFEEAAAETQTPPPMKASVSWKRWMLAAASVALLAAVVWFFSLPEPSLYSQYAQHAPLALTERGPNETDAVEAERAFNAGRYAGALAALDHLLNTQPGHLRARLYHAICLLELNRPAEARAELEPLAQGQSALRGDAIWYVALSYLRENNAVACTETLERLTPNDDHYETARELIHQMK